MNRIFWLIFGVTLLGTAYVVRPVMTDTYRRYRGRKIVVCPETGQIAEIELNAKEATLLSALGNLWLRVKWCSLWPRQERCAEDCLTNLCRKGHHGE